MTILAAFYACLFAAVIPTTVYVLIFYWADRFEREPGWLATVAFLWGAIPAVVVSLAGELVLGLPLVRAPATIETELVESAFLAPVVEELAKAVALFAIYWFVRSEFDGVLDGLLYGALVGFGFAMTENFVYFVGAYREGGFANLTIIFILRSLVFGLNHSFFTGLTGIGLGLARNTRHPWARWLWPCTGLLAAILTHALHNWGATITAVTLMGFGLSLLLAVAGFALLLLTILLSWQQEQQIIQRQLINEVGIILTPTEYATLLGRWRNPLLRGKKNRGQTTRLRQCVELALRKHRLQRLGDENEPTLKSDIIQLRANLEQTLV
jgi:RsiW-degrading membrane proteinase PrsW (M82 family)